jgi:hypothetical protein
LHYPTYDNTADSLRLAWHQSFILCFIYELKFPIKVSCRHPHQGGHKRINYRFARNWAKQWKIVVQCRFGHQPSDIGKGEMVAAFDRMPSLGSFL